MKKIELNTYKCSVHQPIFNIPISNVTPPSFHIIHGMGIKLLKIAELKAYYLNQVLETKRQSKTLEEIYKNCSAFKQAYY